MKEREPYQEFLNGATEGIAGCLGPVLIIILILFFIVMIMMPFYEIARLFE